MRVAKRVDIQNVDVRGRQKEVLEERGEHVPRIEEQERHDKVQDICTRHGDDEGGEDGVFEQVGDVEAVFRFCLHGFDGDEDGRKHQVAHDDDPEVDHCHVEPVASLGAVAEGEDETCH